MSKYMIKLICVEGTRFVEPGILNSEEEKNKVTEIIATIHNLASILQIRKLRHKDVFITFKSPT